MALTKTLSRLGRNSSLVDLYTSMTFPKYGVRYIAINDNYDSDDPNSINNDFAGIKNWFDEFYAVDTSRKIRAVQRAKGAMYLTRIPKTLKDGTVALLYMSLNVESIPAVSLTSRHTQTPSWTRNIGITQ